MSNPSHRLFARLYDPVMSVPERTVLGRHREYLADGLSGSVLDIGSGTGAMFPYFGGDVSVQALEPDPHMRRRASGRTGETTATIALTGASAETLPYDDDTFDAVVASFVFCTIPDHERALDEVARVLRPGGEFRFVEHVRARDALGVVHDALAPGWYHAAGGCNLNRQTGDLFRTDDRFELLAYDRFESGLTRLLPLVRGRLERRGTVSLRERLL